MTDLAAVFFLNATLIMVVLAWYAWHVNRLAHANRSLTAFLLLLAVGNAGQIFFHTATTPDGALLCYRFSWIGWSLYPCYAVLMAMHLTGHAHLLRGWRGLALLFLPALIFLVRSQTGLLGISGIEATADGFALVRRYEPWDIAYPVFQYGYDLIAMGIIGWWAARSRSRRKRLQAVAIIGSACLALVIDFLQYALDAHGALAMLWGMEQLVFSAGMALALTRLQFTMPTARLAAGYIIESIRDLVLLTDAEGKILQVNNPGSALLGYDPAMLVGYPIDAFLFHDGVALFPIATEEQQSREARFLARDGEGIPMLLASSPLRDAYGDVVGVVVVGKDLRQTRQLEQEIAERRRVEEALREADQAKDRFLATLSHELLTPLAVMQSWIEVAQTNPAHAEKALDFIAQNVHRQHRLVKDLLDTSSIIHNKMQLQC